MSTQRTSAPSASRRSHRWLPMKPEPPVTKTRRSTVCTNAIPDLLQVNENQKVVPLEGLPTVYSWLSPNAGIDGMRCLLRLRAGVTCSEGSIWLRCSNSLRRAEDPFVRHRVRTSFLARLQNRCCVSRVIALEIQSLSRERRESCHVVLFP